MDPVTKRLLINLARRYSYCLVFVLVTVPRLVHYYDTCWCSY